MMRIVLADDENLTRSALVMLLDLEEDMKVVAQVSDGQSAVDAVTELRPDIAVLDLEMPVLDGVQAAQAIREACPETAVALVTRHARPGVLKRALTVGVRGFVPKTTPVRQLASILRDVHRGGHYVDPEIAAIALAEGQCPLTERELDVLRQSRSGEPITTIARRVSLAPGTVRNYLSSAMSKLGTRTRHDAARRAWEEGWI